MTDTSSYEETVEEEECEAGGVVTAGGAPREGRRASHGCRFLCWTEAARSPGGPWWTVVGRMDFQCPISLLFTYCRNLKFDIEVPGLNVDAIPSTNSTNDHCKEFVAQKGLVPLLGIMGLSNLPIDFPVSQACQSVAFVCKSILVRSGSPYSFTLNDHYIWVIPYRIYTSTTRPTPRLSDFDETSPNSR